MAARLGPDLAFVENEATLCPSAVGRVVDDDVAADAAAELHPSSDSAMFIIRSNSFLRVSSASAPVSWENIFAFSRYSGASTCKGNNHGALFSLEHGCFHRFELGDNLNSRS